MHRLILAAPAGIEVDHRNGNGLDNRRANIRLATRQQNSQNRPPNRTNSSGFKGALLISGRVAKPWRACIGVDGKNKIIGHFASAEEAGRAYDQAARELFGEFAWLNFPDEAEENIHDS